MALLNGEWWWCVGCMGVVGGLYGGGGWVVWWWWVGCMVVVGGLNGGGVWVVWGWWVGCMVVVGGLYGGGGWVVWWLLSWWWTESETIWGASADIAMNERDWKVFSAAMEVSI